MPSTVTRRTLIHQLAVRAGRRLVLAAVLLAAAPAAMAACAALLNHTQPRLQDERPVDLCDYAGKVVLIVNTASFCGYTGQYKALESLNQTYGPRGFVVLGFPSNDFGRQEPGSNAQIADFCESTFGVRFPMFSKSSVLGANANPVFKGLAERTGDVPQWNFHKYLIGRDGADVVSFRSAVDPQSRQVTREIERMLNAK